MLAPSSYHNTSSSGTPLHPLLTAGQANTHTHTYTAGTQTRSELTFIKLRPRRRSSVNRLFFLRFSSFIIEYLWTTPQNKILKILVMVYKGIILVYPSVFMRILYMSTGWRCFTSEIFVLISLNFVLYLCCIEFLKNKPHLVSEFSRVQKNTYQVFRIFPLIYSCCLHDCHVCF